MCVWCVCVHIPLCEHACMQVCVCVVCVHVPLCGHVCLCVCVVHILYVYMFPYVNMYACVLYMCCVCACTPMWAYVCECMSPYVDM